MRGLHELFPQHRVGALARCVLLRPVGARGEGQVHVLDRDGTVRVDPEPPQCRDQFVARLPRDIAQHHVADRITGHPRQHHEMGGADGPLQQARHLVRAVGGDEQAQMQHNAPLGGSDGSELAQ